MRLFQLTFLSLVLFIQPTRAQEVSDTFGVIAGITSFNQSLSNESGLVETDSSQLTGIFSGVFGEVPLKGSLFLSPGISFSQKGIENSSTKFKVSYLEMSGQLRWFFINTNDFRVYLGSGLGFGTLLSADEIGASGISTDQFGLIEKNELSWQGSLGLELSLSNETALQLGFSYVQGLSNHLSNSAVVGKWQGIYLTTGLRFKDVASDSSPEERARDYIKFKTSKSLGMKKKTNQIEEQIDHEEGNWNKSEESDLETQKGDEGDSLEGFSERSLFDEDFSQEREPSSRARAPSFKSSSTKDEKLFQSFEENSMTSEENSSLGDWEDSW